MAGKVDISKYIYIAIQKNNSVILPGIGEFVSQQSPGRINEVTNTVYPPARTVAFSTTSQQDDGILAQEIAEAEGLPLHIAQQAVTSFSESIVADLKNGSTVLLPNIGELYENMWGEVKLETFEYLNLDSQTFGLPPVVLPHAVQPPIATESIETSADETQAIPLASFELEKIQQTASTHWADTDETQAISRDSIPPLIKTDDTHSSAANKKTISEVLESHAAEQSSNDTSRPRYVVPTPPPAEPSKNNSTWWRWLLPLLIILLLGALIAQLFNRKKDTTLVDTETTAPSVTESETTSTTTVTAESAMSPEEVKAAEAAAGNTNAGAENLDNRSITAAETTTTTDEPASSETTSTTEATPPPSAPEKTPPAESTTSSASTINGVKVTAATAASYDNAQAGYYVVIGAFKDAGNAKRLTSKIKQQGYDARTLQSSGLSRTAIFIGQSADKTQAQYQKSKTVHNPQSWILRIN